MKIKTLIDKIERDKEYIELIIQEYENKMSNIEDKAAYLGRDLTEKEQEKVDELEEAMSTLNEMIDNIDDMISALEDLR